MIQYGIFNDHNNSILKYCVHVFVYMVFLVTNMYKYYKNTDMYRSLTDLLQQ